MRRLGFGSKRFYICLALLLAALLGVILLSLGTGTLSITPAGVWKTLIGQGTKQQTIALMDIRLPRIVIGLLVGAALSVSGAILQSVTGNELAEPGILGISSGSAFFAVVYIYLTNGHNYYSMNAFTIFTMPLISLSGGMLAAGLIYILAWKRGIKPTRLLLMGIAINAFFLSLIIIAQLSFNTKDFNRVLAWTSGSIWGANWRYVWAVAPIILLFLGLALYKSRYLDVFTLGDELSTGLGVRVERQRLILIAFSVVLAGTATAVAGNVAFVGLLAPHMARRLVGPRHKYLVVISSFIGMVLVVVSDIIARYAFAPIELHLGLVVSIIGVPYFIYLMIKEG